MNSTNEQTPGYGVGGAEMTPSVFVNEQEGIVNYTPGNQDLVVDAEGFERVEMKQVVLPPGMKTVVVRGSNVQGGEQYHEACTMRVETKMSVVKAANLNEEEEGVRGLVRLPAIPKLKIFDMLTTGDISRLRALSGGLNSQAFVNLLHDDGLYYNRTKVTFRVLNRNWDHSCLQGIPNAPAIAVEVAKLHEGECALLVDEDLLLMGPVKEFLEVFFKHNTRISEVKIDVTCQNSNIYCQGIAHGLDVLSKQEGRPGVKKLCLIGQPGEIVSFAEVLAKMTHTVEEIYIKFKTWSSDMRVFEKGGAFWTAIGRMVKMRKLSIEGYGYMRPLIHNMQAKHLYGTPLNWLDTLILGPVLFMGDDVALLLNNCSELQYLSNVMARNRIGVGPVQIIEQLNPFRDGLIARGTQSGLKTWDIAMEAKRAPQLFKFIDGLRKVFTVSTSSLDAWLGAETLYAYFRQKDRYLQLQLADRKLEDTFEFVQGRLQSLMAVEKEARMTVQPLTGVGMDRSGSFTVVRENFTMEVTLVHCKDTDFLKLAALANN